MKNFRFFCRKKNIIKCIQYDYLIELLDVMEESANDLKDDPVKNYVASSVLNLKKACNKLVFDVEVR